MEKIMELLNMLLDFIKTLLDKIGLGGLLEGFTF